MQAQPQDLQTLLDLVKIDRAVLSAKKKLENLPQRAQILTARKKRDAFLEKQRRVAIIRHAAEQELAKILNEDSILEEKQTHVQAAIDSQRGDFRSVEAHTKELNGVVKRRKTLDEALEEVDGRIEKIKTFQSQIETLLSSAKAEEDVAIQSFRAEGSELKVAIDVGQKAVDQHLAKLPEELSQLYQKTAKRCGGVAVAALEDNRCSVCRSTIDEAHLIDLRVSRPLGICPACKRLLIVDTPPMQ